MKTRTGVIVGLAISCCLFSAGCMDPVVANAGADRSVDAGAIVTLDGSRSRPEDRTRLSYQWQVVDGPSATFGDATAPVTEFTAPQSATETTYRIQLTVTYIGFTGELVPENSDSDEILIRVRAGTGDGTTAPNSGETSVPDTQADNGDSSPPTDPTSNTNEATPVPLPG